MAELKVYLPDELAKRFRKTAMSVHGYGRGSLSKAATEALTKWCTEHEEPPQAPSPKEERTVLEPSAPQIQEPSEDASLDTRDSTLQPETGSRTEPSLSQS
jgi:hypothetical protein